MVKNKKIAEVVIKPSTRGASKHMAIFKNGEGIKIKTIHFGAKGYRDNTLINKKGGEFYIEDEDKRNKVKSLYISRHKSSENWEAPDNAGSLSRWILWDKPTFKEGVDAYKKRFNLK